MRGLKKGLAVLFFASLLIFAFTTTASAQVGSKQVKLEFNNFKVTADGKQVNLPTGVEPFGINGTIYVPLRVAAEAINSEVFWQSQAKTVVITSGTSGQDADLKKKIADKDKQIKDLKEQVAELEEEEEEEADLSDLERDLLDDYDEIVDVDVDDIILDGDEDEVEVTVEVDLDDYEDEWEDLRDSDIDDWVEDLVSDIQDELSRYTEVTGEIINVDDDKVLVEFSKDGTRRLSVTYQDSKYRGNSDDVDDVAAELKGDRFYVDNIEFKITTINYYEGDDEIRVYLKAQEGDASVVWNDLKKSIIEDDVEGICDDIAQAFEDDADADPESIYIKFLDEDSDVLTSYWYDVDEESLD